MAEPSSLTPPAAAISDDWQRVSDDELSVRSLPSDDEESPGPGPCPCPRPSPAHSTSSNQDGTAGHAEGERSWLGAESIKEACHDQEEISMKKGKHHNSALKAPKTLWNRIQQHVQAISPAPTMSEHPGSESYSSVDRLLEDFALEGEARRILANPESAKESVSRSDKRPGQPLSQGKADQQRPLPTASDESKKHTSPSGQTNSIHSLGLYPTAASTGQKTLHSTLAQPLAHPISIRTGRQPCPDTAETVSSPVSRYGNPLQYYGPTRFLLQQSVHRPFSSETTPESAGSGTVRPSEVLYSASDKIQDSLKKLKLLSQPLKSAAPIWKSREACVPRPNQTTAPSEQTEMGCQDVDSRYPGTGADPVSLRDKLQSVKSALSETLTVIYDFGCRAPESASEISFACTSLQEKVDDLLPVLWRYAEHFRNSPATFSAKEFPFHASFARWMSDVLTCLSEIRSEIEKPCSLSLDNERAGGFHTHLRELTHLIHSFRAEIATNIPIIQVAFQAYRTKRKAAVTPAVSSASSPTAGSETKEAVNSPDARTPLLALTSELRRVVKFLQDCLIWLCWSAFRFASKAIATMNALSNELALEVVVRNVSVFRTGWNRDGRSMEKLVGELEEYRKFALLVDAGNFQAGSKAKRRDEGNKVTLDEARLECLEIKVAGFLESTRKIRGETVGKTNGEESREEADEPGSERQ